MPAKFNSLSNSISESVCTTKHARHLQLMPGIFRLTSLFMPRSYWVVVICALGLWSLPLAGAQTGRKAPVTEGASSIQDDLAQAEHGHCAQALPALKREIPKVESRDLRRRAGVDGVRCAMSLNQPTDAVEFLGVLGHDFANDPEALYLMVHAYSDLSTQAAEQLARTAPNSAEAHELQAEAYEQQGKWDLAAAEYNAVLKQHPDAPGIHFRIGRLLLSKPNPGPDVVEQARQEMLAELKIDPSNAGAEYVLGELAHQEEKWDEAIQHFSRASTLDAGFGDAFLGLGESLIATKKFAEAIPPLEKAVELESANPATHYNLATAFSRTGRKAEADKEFAIHRQMMQQPNAQSPENSQPNPN
jgi:tetratricopeptide (TPR) repeat protein